MEIKKYVLLKNNTIGKLYERYNLGFLYVEEKGGITFTRNASLSDVKLTSDNIFDLVEVGDMVMRDDYVGALKVLSNTKHYFRTYHATVAKKNVKAIYKSQPNGDYKRYEVEKNEN